MALTALQRTICRLLAENRIATGESYVGYLAWAACGKDPGFSPEAILSGAARSGRYSADEVAELAFDGPPPDAGELARRWHALLEAARETIRVLPAEDVGKCVLTPGGQLFTGDQEQARHAASAGSLRFHAGRLRGAFPQFVR